MIPSTFPSQNATLPTVLIPLEIKHFVNVPCDICCKSYLPSIAIWKIQINFLNPWNFTLCQTRKWKLQASWKCLIVKENWTEIWHLGLLIRYGVHEALTLAVFKVILEGWFGALVSKWHSLFETQWHIWGTFDLVLFKVIWDHLVHLCHISNDTFLV